MKIVKLTNEKKAGAVAFAITLAYALVLYFGSTMYSAYDTNAIRMILTGELTGTPSAHAIYCNYLVGLLLSRLYGALPAVNWYYLWLLLAEFSAVWAILYNGLRRYVFTEGRRNLPAFLALAVMTNLFLYGIIVRMMYTYVSAICGIAFIVCAFIHEKPSSADFALCAVFAFLCASTRIDNFKMILPFALVLMIWRCFESKSLAVSIRVSVILAGVAIIVAGSNMLAYTGEYAEEKELNSLRTCLQDYIEVPPYAENTAFYDSLGITEAEAALLSRDCWGLCENYQIEPMTEIVTLAKVRDVKSLGLTVYLVREELKDAYRSTAPWLIAAAVAGVLLCFASVLFGGKKLRIIPFVCILGVFCAEILYLAYLGRMPFRAFYPVIPACLASLFVLTPPDSDENKKDKKLKAAFCVALLLFAGMGVFGGVMEVRDYEKDLESCASLFDLEAYLMSDSDSIYLYKGNSFRSRFELFNWQKADYTRLTGWITGTPEWKRYVQGENHDILEAICARRDLCFVTSPGSVSVPLLCEYLNQHGFSVTAEKDSRFFDGVEYTFWKISEA